MADEVQGGDLALALGGGGARSAYQVGFLRELGRWYPDLEVPILTGVSAGAIGATFLANHQGNFGRATEDLASLWQRLTVDQVFRTGSYSLASNALRWGLRLISGGARLRPHTRGMVDASPLRRFLCDGLGTSDGTLPGVRAKVANGRLKALAITTADYATRQSVTWIQGHAPAGWSRPHRRGVTCELTIEHVLASSALPLFFPAVRIGPHWHGDGGIRLTTPLSPALHLGAQRILALSTRYQRTQAEADSPQELDYPPPASVIGLMLAAIFLDNVDHDAMNLQRINELVRELPPEKRGDLRTISLLVIRPSSDISLNAARHEPTLPKAFRFLSRGLGTRESKSSEALSMVLFQPDYIGELLRVGQEDARRRREEIEAFVEGEAGPSVQQTGFWRI